MLSERRGGDNIVHVEDIVHDVEPGVCDECREDESLGIEYPCSSNRLVT